MIRVLTTITSNCSLFPHFLGYYLSLGVDQIVVAVHPDKVRIEEVQEASRQLPVVIVPTSQRHQRTGVEGFCKEELRQSIRCGAGDWIIPADLDEFHQYPDTVAKLIVQLQSNHMTHCTGIFSDRIAMDGTLPPDRPTPSLWDQFSIEADVTQKLVRGNFLKVVLCRGNHRLGIGHHYLMGVPPARPIATIHHFKWRGGIIEALERRVTLYRDQQVPWWPESERVVDYFRSHNGRLDLRDFVTKPGWKPDIPTLEARATLS